MKILDKLTPQPIWSYFEDICQVPRPSKREEKIIKFLIDFAKSHNLSAKRDEAGNVLISKPAVKGKESVPTVILQSHVDMVCEKNAETIHDFDNDPIIPVVDGEWVTANGTTLGADCGIGMAAQLAVLTSDSIKHGPIECLFTVDEETGLSGAFALGPDFLSGKTLINLDSEDEGELFIGCAGGIDTVATMSFKKEQAPENHFALKISVKGLLGGHSGDDINKGRGNAIKILNRFLWQIRDKYDLYLVEFNGGNLRNAIAREAFAIIMIPPNMKESITVDFNIYRGEIEDELLITEPNIKLVLESVDNKPDFVIDKESVLKLTNAVYTCPHGVISMSYRMPGMVETSTNLASVKFSDNSATITTSQRSDIKTSVYDASAMVQSTFLLAGAEVKRGDGYPGWTPDPDSKILEISKKSYEKLFKVEPVVRSIHAGLECGLFLEKYPGMDMISFGPTLRGVHSPDERKLSSRC
jgi:dipeptidase D